MVASVARQCVRPRSTRRAPAPWRSNARPRLRRRHTPTQCARATNGDKREPHSQSAATRCRTATSTGATTSALPDAAAAAAAPPTPAPSPRAPIRARAQIRQSRCPQWEPPSTIPACCAGSSSPLSAAPTRRARTDHICPENWTTAAPHRSATASSTHGTPLPPRHAPAACWGGRVAAVPWPPKIPRP